MRHIIVTILILCFHILLFPQVGFEYLDSGNEKNIAIQAFETENKEYIFSFISSDDEESSCSNGIIQLTENGLLLNQTFFCNDTLELTAYDFYEMEDGLIIIGNGFNPDEQKNYLWFRKVNENLSVLAESFYYLSNNDVLCINSFRKEEVIYCVGTTTTYNPFVASLDITGQFLFSKTDFEFNDYVNGLFIDEEEEKYILRGNRLRIFDMDFNLVETIPDLPFGFWQQGEMIGLSDTTYLITGKSVYSLEDRQFGIGILSADFEELNSISFGLQNDTIDFPGAYRSVSKRYDNNYYFGGTSNMEIIASPFGTIPSWFNLSLIDLNLNILWNKLYGGDAYYNMFGVLATSDGGCLMYGLKHDYENNPNELQLYILKVNENGDIISATSQPIMKDDIIHVYPNPFSDKIKLKFSSSVPFSQFNLSIHDSIGRLLIEIKNLSSDQTINTSNLTSGIYYAKLMNNNGKCVATKKLLKQ